MEFEHEVGVVSKYDPKQICYSDPDTLGSFAGPRTAQELWGGSLDWDTIDVGRFERELDALPPLEADLIMAWVGGSRQEDLSAIFGICQAGISYRIRRGIDRLRWAASLPEITEGDLRHDLRGHVSDEQLEALVHFARTKNMYETARLMGAKQPRCRDQILDAIEALTGKPDLARHAQYFSAVLKRVGHQLRRTPTDKAAQQRAERLRRLKSGVT